MLRRLCLRRRLARTTDQRAEARSNRQIAIRYLREVTGQVPEPVPAISIDHALDRLIVEAYEARREA
jgi:hypothetical protein